MQPNNPVSSFLVIYSFFSTEKQKKKIHLEDHHNTSMRQYANITDDLKLIKLHNKFVEYLIRFQYAKKGDETEIRSAYKQNDKR